MNLKRIILFAGLSIIIFISFPFLLFTNRNLAYYAYKEITYKFLVDNLVRRIKKPIERIIIFQDYFYYNLFSPFEAKVVDKDVYNDLIRGIAYCDQRSWGLGTFLGRIGIDNRLVMTKNPEGISNHTVLEVFIDNKWVFFDPFYGLFINDEKGKPASYMDICNNPSFFYLCPEMIMLKKINPQKYENVKEYFTKNVFYNNPTKPEIRNNPVENKDFKHKIITGILDLYKDILGNCFSYLYQDAYLSHFSPLGESECIYFKARNYDQYGRYKLAIESYKKIISKYPENSVSEDTLFFLGVLYDKIKDFDSSIDTLQMLLKKHPDTKWKRIAHYYLGYGFELLKNYDLAKDYYLRAINLYNELGPAELRPTELKVVRRLYALLNK